MSSHQILQLKLGRLVRSFCRARTASGIATAPPIRVMNFRCCMSAPERHSTGPGQATEGCAYPRISAKAPLGERRSSRDLSARRRKHYCVMSIFTAVVMVCQCLISPSSQVFASASDLFGTILKFCLLSFSIASGQIRDLFIAANNASSTRFGVAAGANRPFKAHSADIGISDFFHGRNVGTFFEPRVIDHGQWAEFSSRIVPRTKPH